MINDNKEPENFDSEFAKLLANVGQPNILPKIFTVGIIDKISEDGLIYDMYQHIGEKIWAEEKKTTIKLTALPTEQQIFFKTFILEMEVSNGGLNQFYHNQGEQFAKDIPNYLSLIGAKELAKLMLKANATFEIENKKITKNQNGTLDGFSKSYDNNPLNDLDDEFYEINEIENLQLLQIDFIRKNKVAFIDK